VFLVQVNLLFRIKIRIKLFVSPTVFMVNEDYFTKMMKILAYVHMIEQRLPPVWVCSLSKTKTSPCQHKLIIVVIISHFFHEDSCFINKPEVHTGHNKTFSSMSQDVFGYITNSTASHLLLAFLFITKSLNR